MKTTSSGSDPVLDVIVGRDGKCLSLASSAAVTFVCCLVLAASVAAGALDRDVAFGAVLVLVCLVGWRTAPATAVAVALLGFLFTDGFVHDRFGNLAWHGEDDAMRVALFVCLAVTASLLGHQLSRARQVHPPWSTSSRGGPMHDLRVFRMGRVKNNRTIVRDMQVRQDSGARWWCTGRELMATPWN